MKQFFNYRDFEAIPIMRCEFEPEFVKKFKKAYKVFLFILIGVMFTLSVITITKWVSFDGAYYQGMTDTMRANNGQGKKISYAGASGEGRIMNAEDKNGR